MSVHPNDLGISERITISDYNTYLKLFTDEQLVPYLEDFDATKNMKPGVVFSFKFKARRNLERRPWDFNEHMIYAVKVSENAEYRFFQTHKEAVGYRVLRGLEDNGSFSISGTLGGRENRRGTLYRD